MNITYTFADLRKEASDFFIAEKTMTPDMGSRYEPWRFLCVFAKNGRLLYAENGCSD
jgi:hypothetical protein